MIVAETDGGFRLVTQPDHAALVGHFADHWGNDAFARPDPSPAVAIAGHVHDDGWWSRDRCPRLAEDDTPEDFTEVSPTPWIDLYDGAIDAAIDVDPYAGLLVAMHGVGLRRRRYGLSPSWGETPPAYGDFVERQEARQRSLARELREQPAEPVTGGDLGLLDALHESGTPPEGADTRLWRNYRLLQAWDALSLSFCTTISPPGDGEVGPVPTGAGAGDESLAIEPAGDGTFAVDPFPFDREPLEAVVPSRTVRSRAFDDGADLVDAYYGAAREAEPITLERTGR